MFIKQKHPTIDIAVLMVVLTAGIVVWALQRSYALVQQADISLSTSSNPLSRIDTASASAATAQDALQFERMNQFHQELEAAVNDYVAAEPNEHGIFIKHLTTKDVVASGSDDRFISASLYKPIVTVRVLQMVDNEEAELTEVLPETDGRNISQCISAAISLSDNPCGRALRSRSGLSSTAGLAVLRDMGLKNTDLRGDYPVTTARDTALLYEKIYNGSLLEPETNQLLLDALKAQRVNNRLPQGLPPETEIAHKTGDLEGAAHDGGIVFSPAGDYIIVIMSGMDTSGRDLETRYERMAELTRQVHTVMLNAPQLENDAS